MCLCALFAVLIAVGAFIKLPISIVPITMQTLFVILAGFFLKEKAFYCVLLYVGMGLIGFPIFTSGGGLSYVLVPTFGYLIGFIICSYFVGHTKSDKFSQMLVNSLIGVLIIYIIGILYFIFIQYFYYQQVFAMSWIIYSLFIVFLPGDVLSCIIAIIIYKRLKAYVIL